MLPTLAQREGATAEPPGGLADVGGQAGFG